MRRDMCDALAEGCSTGEISKTGMMRAGVAEMSRGNRGGMCVGKCDSYVHACVGALGGFGGYKGELVGGCFGLCKKSREMFDVRARVCMVA